MKTSATGLNLIAEFEGFKAKRYICPAGFPTIGYGHVIKKSEKFTSVTKEEALALLEKDVKIAESGLKKAVTVPLNQNQFDALVSFCFNLGVGTFLNSVLRKKINAELLDECPAQILRFVYANHVVLEGLVRRRQAEADLFKTPVSE